MITIRLPRQSSRDYKEAFASFSCGCPSTMASSLARASGSRERPSFCRCHVAFLARRCWIRGTNRRDSVVVRHIMKVAQVETKRSTHSLGLGDHSSHCLSLFKALPRAYEYFDVVKCSALECTESFVVPCALPRHHVVRPCRKLSLVPEPLFSGINLQLRYFQVTRASSLEFQLRDCRCNVDRDINPCTVTVLHDTTISLHYQPLPITPCANAALNP